MMDIPLQIRARSRNAVGRDAGSETIREETICLNPSQTAAILCDMWDTHWCASAAARTVAMAPRMDAVVRELRRRGVLIIHAPSDTMDFYKEHPGRRLALDAPASGDIPPYDWKRWDSAQEAPLPIDDSDGGCDCAVPCRQGSPWTRQIESIAIMDSDAITDNAEAIHLMRQRGIVNVLMLGVAANMCVLGRPFGIRRLIEQSFHVWLVRDMTDSMYNPAMPPYVDHDEGTELVVQHIEKYWCSTITSDQIYAGS